MCFEQKGRSHFSPLNQGKIKDVSVRLTQNDDNKTRQRANNSRFSLMDVQNPQQMTHCTKRAAGRSIMILWNA